MKKISLIIVSIYVMFSLVGCSSSIDSAQPYEMAKDAEIVVVGGPTSSGFVLIVHFINDKKENRVLIQFDPPDDLKITAEIQLKKGQKFHIKYEDHYNFIGSATDPRYQTIKEISLVPSGEKFNF